MEQQRDALQSRGRRFDSDPCLDLKARVAELVDATDLKSVVRKDVPVRVRPWAPRNIGFFIKSKTMDFFEKKRVINSAYSKE